VALREAELARKAADEHSAEAEAERRRAEAANQAKSAFLANMSHELRTPLNAVIGFAQLIDRDRSLVKENREHLGIILRSGEHLLGLINDVLSLSKIEAGQVTLAPVAFEIQPFLKGLSEMMQVRAEAKGLDLLFEAEKLPVRTVLGDDSKLRQLLINLLGNAIKFTKKGHVALRASWAAGRASFEVEDTGPGLTTEEMAKLFRPFVQTETGERAREGTGLGLAISRTFARLMGGDITVQSERGSGSTFSVTVDLPLASDAGDSRPSEVGRKVIRLAAGQEFRVLVVDDILENRILLSKLLESVGFDVRQAANGQEAVEQWRGYRPHFIWMDMRMPVMDGMTATKVIREAESPDGPRVKIVALSASALEHESAAVTSLGCDDFLAKPYRETVMFEKLAEHLGARFEYDSEIPPGNGGGRAGVLTAERLESLAVELRRPLHEALQIGDDEAALKLVAGIRSADPALAEALAESISRFQVDELLNLLEELQRKAP
jgi:CheY-like chemotaxis protein